MHRTPENQTGRHLGMSFFIFIEPLEGGCFYSGSTLPLSCRLKSLSVCIYKIYSLGVGGGGWGGEFKKKTKNNQPEKKQKTINSS